MIAANRAQRLSAGMLALLVHGLFLLALMFGVSWRSLPDLPVYADLWDALPSTPEPPAIEAAPPEAPAAQVQPQPAPVPTPARPDVVLSRKPEPKSAAPTPPQSREEPDKARQEQEARQREAELAAAEEARRQAQAQARNDLERELARQAESDMARELEVLHRSQQIQAQSARGRLIMEHRQAIGQHIRQYLRPCPKLPVNKEVIFTAQLLPSGDLKHLHKVQGSGSDACDGDVERAIRKAFPIPLPQDREVARAFTREALELRLRPNETPAAEGRG